MLQCLYNAFIDLTYLFSHAKHETNQRGDITELVVPAVPGNRQRGRTLSTISRAPNCLVVGVNICG
jgi:hypothetical protein